MSESPTDSAAAKALLVETSADAPIDKVTSSLAKRDAWVRQSAADYFAYLCSQSSLTLAREAFQAVLDKNKRPAHRPSKEASPKVRVQRATLATFVELHLADGSVAKHDRTVAGAARRYCELHPGQQSVEAVEKKMRRAIEDYPIRSADKKSKV